MLFNAASKIGSPDLSSNILSILFTVLLGSTISSDFFPASYNGLVTFFLNKLKLAISVLFPIACISLFGWIASKTAWLLEMSLAEKSSVIPVVWSFLSPLSILARPAEPDAWPTVGIEPGIISCAFTSLLATAGSFPDKFLNKLAIISFLPDTLKGCIAAFVTFMASPATLSGLVTKLTGFV